MRPSPLLRSLCLTVLLALPAGAHAQDAAAAQHQIAAGERLFEKSCRICHGEAGVGNRAAALRGTHLTTDYVSRIIVDGKAGTMMPRFGGAFGSGQIRQLAEYVASLQRPDSITARLRGDAANGERVFFDATQSHSCQGCHALNGRGRRVGPDLTTRLRGKAPREIFERIVIVPHRSADPAYVTVEIALRTGERIRGIQAEDHGGRIRFYDTSVLPPAVRTLARADIVSVTPVRGSVMPSDYASRFALQELLDLVAFLSSALAGAPVEVRFDDVVMRRTSGGR